MGGVVAEVESAFDAREADRGDVQGVHERCEGDAGLGSPLTDLVAGGHRWRVRDDIEDLAGDLAFEAAHDVAAGFAFGSAAGDVGASARGGASGPGRWCSGR